MKCHLWLGRLWYTLGYALMTFVAYWGLTELA